MPAYPRTGQPIRAAFMIELMDWVAARTNIVAGAGLNVDLRSDCTRISMGRPGRLELYEGVITAAPEAPDGDLAPEDCKYAYQIKAWEGSLVEDRIPDWGRNVKAARVVPAMTGDPCFVGIVIDSDLELQNKLFILTEQTATEECDTPPPGAGARSVGGGVVGVSEFERLVEAVAVRLRETGRG